MMEDHLQWGTAAQEASKRSPVLTQRFAPSTPKPA